LIMFSNDIVKTEEMKIIFRVDASIEIGSGHLMRCLTLADSLHQRGCDVLFVCRELPGDLCHVVANRGYTVYRLPNRMLQVANGSHDLKDTDRISDYWVEDAFETKAILQSIERPVNYLIVDHYLLDKRWEEQMRAFVKKIMVIDDLANRPHDCNLLLDQNLYDNLDTRYNGLVPQYCRRLLGPQYFLLRPEFWEAREGLERRDGSIRRVLVFLGGGDPTNETVKALRAIRLLNLTDVSVDVVVGATNLQKQQVKRFCADTPNVSYHCQVENMAQLMADADLAIGAGGVTIWERCFLGLPSITLVLAQNQVETTAVAAAAGAIWNLGWAADVEVEDLAEAIKRAIGNQDAMFEMGLAAARMMGNLTPEDKNILVGAIMEGSCATSERVSP